MIPSIAHSPNLEKRSLIYGLGIYGYKYGCEGNSVTSPLRNFSAESYTTLNLSPGTLLIWHPHQLRVVCAHTCRLLGKFDNLADGRPITRAMQLLIPILQRERRDYELCQVSGVGGDYHLITSGTGDGSLAVRNIYPREDLIEMAGNVRHAEVIEENTVAEACPFEGSGAQECERFFAQVVGGDA
jgi:hypothetical protein